MVEKSAPLCPAAFFELYIHHLNPDNEYLFQRPKKSFDSSHNMWYDDMVVGERLWPWLRAGYMYLEKGAEGYVFAAQEQAQRIRFFRATIDKEDFDPKRGVCRKKVESVGH